MKRLALGLLLCTGAALADSSYVGDTTGTYIAAQRDLTLAAGSGAAWFNNSAPISSGTKKAYSQALGFGLTLNGTVTISVATVLDYTFSRVFTLAVGFRRGGADTAICSNTTSVTAAASPNTSSISVTCNAAAVGLLTGDNMYLAVTYPALTDSVLPETTEIDSGAASVITWPQVLWVCPTAGAVCVCNGICNGASCGSQFSTAAQSVSCACNCNIAACMALNLAAPTPLTCVDKLNASQETLTWGSVPGAATYSLAQGGINVFTGNALTFVDTPGVGVYSYNVFASGSCIPAIGGTPLPSVNTLSNTTNACLVSSRGAIVTTGMNDHNPYCRLR